MSTASMPGGWAPSTTVMIPRSRAQAASRCTGWMAPVLKKTCWTLSTRVRGPTCDVHASNRASSLGAGTGGAN